jgi:hypothetical protein
MNISTSNQGRLLKALRRRHPDYAEKLLHWEFLDATYKGGRDWFVHNIFRYMKEGDQEFKDRLARAYRFNHTREIVDLVQKYIFKSPPQRNIDDASKEIQDFWKDCTLSGLDIDQFMKLVSTASSIDGRIWVFTDTTKTEGAISVADAKKQGAKVYAYIVRARNILDMGFDDDTNELRWILVREFYRDDDDPIDATGAVEERYRLWTQNEWALFRIAQKKPTPDQPPAQPDTFAVIAPTSLNPTTTLASYVTSDVQSYSDNVEVQVIDRGEVSIGRVPCFSVDNVISEHKYSAPALIEDIAYLDRAVANYLSNLDAIIQDQTFSQLAMPAQGVLPGDEKYDQLREMGTKRIFLFDGEGGTKPEYLSPDPKQAGVITDVVNKIIHEIYHTVGMAGERTKQDNAAGIDNSSGVAKAYDFERLNSLLTTKSSSLQNAENRLVEFVELWNKSKPPTDGLVKYADTFDVRSLFDEFTVAERLALVGAPDMIRRKQMMQVKQKLFPVQSEKDSKAMDDELESWPPPPPPEEVMGVSTGMPPKTFPAKGTQKSAPKNPQTSNRQGQAT